MKIIRKAWAKLVLFCAAIFALATPSFAYTNQLQDLTSAASDISDFFGTVWGIALSIVVAFILLSLLGKVRSRR